MTLGAKRTENIHKGKIIGRRAPSLGKHLHSEIRKKLPLKRKGQRSRGAGGHVAVIKDGERLRKELRVFSTMSDASEKKRQKSTPLNSAMKTARRN